MLYAVLSVRFVCKYAGEVREIYSFFSVGKKREGKCSFCFLSAKSVGQKQNVHFPLRWAISFAFSVTKEELKFQTEEYSLQRQEYKFQMLQYNLHTRNYSLQRQEYKFQTLQYILQTRKYNLQRQEYNFQTCQYNLQSGRI